MLKTWSIDCTVLALPLGTILLTGWEPGAECCGLFDLQGCSACTRLEALLVFSLHQKCRLSWSAEPTKAPICAIEKRPFKELGGFGGLLLF